MTSDCPSRYLTADGRVLACGHRHSDDRMWEERDDPRAVMHYVCWPDSSIVKHSWPDDDPCAWSATCPDCDGEGHTALGHAPDPCPTCEGAGTVDTTPPALIGVGSVLRDVDGGDWVIVSIDPDADEHKRWVLAELTHRASFNVWVPDDCIDEMALVRAVPPAGDTT